MAVKDAEGRAGTPGGRCSKEKGQDR